ncbi:MAG TPA: NADH-quinone oxidoreductase subunit L [Coriobacteriia bacterium]
MSLVLIAALVPGLPAAAAVLLALFGRRIGEKCAWISVGALAGSLVAAIYLLVMAFQGGGEGPLVHATFEWMRIGGVNVDFGLYVDGLSAAVLVMVAAVACMVFVYAIGYMHGDERFPVFFSIFSLFTASMFGVGTSSSLLQLMVFWEIMGVCSFLLIGYYYEREEARRAAFKAFITTRIGDMGFLLAVAVLLGKFGTVDIPTLMARVEEVAPGMQGFLWLMCALLFIGAVAKSAQFPMYIWLPDAMAGPTPVSGLLHSATMVAAGVFLILRTFPMFEAAHFLPMIAGAGIFTAVYGAALALTETDIKRMLAYSTMSQLGYMMAALGCGGYVAAIFHLIAHGFFKSLLFLSAGSVIHGAHTQDIREMRGVGKTMPITAACFLVGSLAIAGIPPLSGFFSKDAILASMLGYAGTAPVEGGIILLVGLMTAVLTAFYMFRVYFGVFTGPGKKYHESSKLMLVPMIVLASIAAVAGVINLPGMGLSLAGLLEPGKLESAVPWLMALSAGAAGAGLYIAWESTRLRAALHGTGPLPRHLQVLYGGIFLRPVFGVSRFLRELKMDQIIMGIVVKPVLWFCELAAKLNPDVLYMSVFVGGVGRVAEGLAVIDTRVVDGFVNGVGRYGLGIARAVGLVDVRGVDGAVNGVADGTIAIGRVFKRLQTGVTANYALFMIVLGVAIFYVAWWLVR